MIITGKTVKRVDVLYSVLRVQEEEKNEKISGGDTVKGNTRTHAEHEG